ncbi:MAG: hypothetical protein NTZ46_08900 [Verrucomicrobia bacterium]|nr:hypothetical protein [Verrucomicrobiota bacterium]
MALTAFMALASALGATDFRAGLTTGLAAAFTEAFGAGLVADFGAGLAACLVVGLDAGLEAAFAVGLAFALTAVCATECDADAFAGEGVFFFCTDFGATGLDLCAGALAAGRALEAAWCATGFAFLAGGEDFLEEAFWTGGAGFLAFFAAGACFGVGEEDFLVVIPRRIQTFVLRLPGVYKEGDKGRVI